MTDWERNELASWVFVSVGGVWILEWGSFHKYDGYSQLST